MSTTPQGAGPQDVGSAPAVFAFPEARVLGRDIAFALGCACHDVTVHTFPDGESRVRLPAEPFRGRAVLLRSLNDPNRTLVEALFALQTLRRRGARQVWLVAPYLGYMRQDAEFEPGEAISQTIVAEWIGRHVDRLYTVDPHLHRTHALEPIFGVPARNLSAAPLISAAVARLGDAWILGPDQESRQWCEQVAQGAGARCAVAHKQRLGDRQVEISLPAGLDVRGKPVVIVDDIASTGRTLAAVASAVRALGPASLHVYVTHALLGSEHLAELKAAGVDEIVSTNSVAHPTNALNLAPLLAHALREDLAAAQGVGP